MKTQMKRMKVSPTVMAMTNRGSFQALPAPTSMEAAGRPATVAGSCAPSMTKITPFKTSCTVSHTALRCVRVAASGRPIRSA